MMARIKYVALALMLASVSISGCFGNDDGNGGGTELLPDQVGDTNGWTAFYAANANALPACNSETLGMLYYVASENTFQTCQSNGWNFVDISGPAGAVGNTGPAGADGEPGTDGSPGLAGADGADGAQGISTLVKTTTLGAGSSCSTGGIILDVGPDSDNDGTLAATEITSSSIICNGEETQASPTPQTLTTQSIPSISDCSEGGVVIATGIDDGSGSGIAMNDALEEDEISQKTTICLNLEMNRITNLGLGKNDGLAGGEEMEIYDGFLYFSGIINSMYTGSGTWTSVKGIWRTDGSLEGTEVVIYGIESSSFEIVNDDLYYTTDDAGSSGDILNKFNLTTSTNTVINGATGYLRVWDDRFGHLDDLLFFNGGTGTTTTRNKLYVSDGTDAGTFQISSAEYPHYFTEMAGTMYFIALEGSSFQLFSSDGTSAGTEVITSFTGVGPNNLEVVGSEIWFSAENGSGYELWKTDGTVGNEIQLADLNPGPGSSNPSGYVEFNGLVYFQANGELYTSDGTESGTVLLKNINLDAMSYPRNFVVFESMLYFTADDGLEGDELWISDGTSAGTTLYYAFNPGTFDGNPDELIVYDGQLCMQVDRLENGEELYCQQIITTFEFL